jgi:AcrR family transcriptional regulator
MAEPRKRRRRQPLSRDRILKAALALADENGIESLTMRRLGLELGYEAMSLYNHAANKDDVIDGILDLVLAESRPPAPDEEWDVAIRRSAVSVHESLGRHPWAATALMSPTRARLARLRYIDSLLGRLRAAGFSAEATYHAYHVLDGHIFGFAVWQASHDYTPDELESLAMKVQPMIGPDEFPHLHEHMRQHQTDGPHRTVSAFELGLDLILDGLGRMRRGSAGGRLPAKRRRR